MGLKCACADADGGPDIVADGVVELIANPVALLFITSTLVTGSILCSQLLCRWF